MQYVVWQQPEEIKWAQKTFWIWCLQVCKIPTYIFDMLELQSAQYLHSVVYHFDMLASSQIYIYSNVFSAVKVDTA